MQRRDFLGIATGWAGALAAGRLGAAGQVWPMPDLIVLLPGITGSVLKVRGKDVWAISGQGIVGALRSLGNNLDALTLKQDSARPEPLGDGVTADRLFEDTHLVPGLWKIDGYTRMRQAIRERFKVEPGRNLIEFPYDWRRDNRSAAHRLKIESHAWLQRWRESSRNKEARLILVAHSMGGLVSRYFLECLEGWQDTRLLITFGTPYRGSLNALNFLANGYEKRIGPFKVADLSALMRSFTSVYQLLPTFPCVDTGDGKARMITDAGALPNVDAAKAADALKFHDEIARAVQANGKIDAYREHGYNIAPIAGVFQPTLQFARLAGGQLACVEELPQGQADGDGTVPRRSATPPELAGKGLESFTAQLHGSLQNASGPLDHMGGVLSQSVNVQFGFRDPPGLRLSLRLDDLYADDEPVRLVAGYRPEDASPLLRLQVSNASTARGVAEESRQARAGSQTFTLRPLPAGTYRAMVSSEGASVTDVFAVAGKD